MKQVQQDLYVPLSVVITVGLTLLTLILRGPSSRAAAIAEASGAPLEANNWNGT